MNERNTHLTPNTHSYSSSPRHISQVHTHSNLSSHTLTCPHTLLSVLTHSILTHVLTWGAEEALLQLVLPLQGVVGSWWAGQDIVQGAPKAEVPLRAELGVLPPQADLPRRAVTALCNTWGGGGVRVLAR